jgi:hypothetical protein
MSSSSSANLAPTLTPLTTTESSPPDKTLSPRSRKRSFDQMCGSCSPSRRPAESRDSPANSSSETTFQPRPGPGKVKGYKIAFDPEIAPGLEPKDRRKYKAKYNSFGDKVRAASSQVIYYDMKLSLGRSTDLAACSTTHRRPAIRDCCFRIIQYQLFKMTRARTRRASVSRPTSSSPTLGIPRRLLDEVLRPES